MTNPTELAMTLARSALEEQAERIAELEEALRQIAKPNHGLEFGDTDDARADYWHAQTEKCRSIARAVLHKEKPRA